MGAYVSKITVIAGDIEAGVYFIPPRILGKEIVMKKQVALQGPGEVTIEVDRIELQTEEGVKRLSGTAGWGLAGLALLGPIGAIGGMMIGGRDKQICFAAHLKDGRKLLATTDSSTYQKFIAVMF
jgi:hypothetical protein